ncbi:MAG: GTP-binding protein [Candidatus Nomurabacteria bacterium]|jgi:cobalamin biosynthesis protein CobW|nr:GTP-binding protein [Candidatus Nomurabacteria bacterium]
MTRIIILSGFLGSGKTTIINNLLKQIGGTVRVGVVVNDFGSIGVDNLLISGAFTEPVELANGCLCCMFDENGLTQPIADLSAAGCDLIIIEASGLAEPQTLTTRLFEVIDTDSSLEFGGFFYVIDGLNYAQAERDFRLNFHASLNFADLVIVNKVSDKSNLYDYISGDARRGCPQNVFPELSNQQDNQTNNIIQEKILGADRAAGPESILTCPIKCPIIFTETGFIDYRIFLETTPENISSRQMILGEKPANTHEHHHHFHSNFTSTTEHFTHPLDRTTFIQTVNSWRVSVFRAKGFLQFADVNGYFAFNKVGTFIDLKPLETYNGESFLIKIEYKK